MEINLKRKAFDKIKILHIIDTLSVGGAEKILVSTINGLPEFEHHLIYLASPDDLLGEVNKECRVLKLKWRSRFSFINDIFIIRKYIKENQISIVHSHLFIATIIARLATPADVKFFTTIHNRPSKSYLKNRPLFRLFEKITYKRRHKLIAVSKTVLDDYNECIGLKGPGIVVNNFIEDKFFRQEIKSLSKDKKLRLVSVGNLHYQKNYPYLFTVFKNLPSSISLDIYGWGDMKMQFQKEIEKSKLNIRLCGVRHDIEKILLNYDAFILASHYEGQPLVVLEAMASGIPVILSDIASLREVTNGHALFFDINDPSDLRKKLIAVLNNEIDLEELTKTNLLRAEQVARKERYLTELKCLYLGGDNKEIEN